MIKLVENQQVRVADQVLIYLIKYLRSPKVKQSLIVSVHLVQTAQVFILEVQAEVLEHNYIWIHNRNYIYINWWWRSFSFRRWCTRPFKK
jgi:hypothetical protein